MKHRAILKIPNVFLRLHEVKRQLYIFAFPDLAKNFSFSDSLIENKRLDCICLEIQFKERINPSQIVLILKTKECLKCLF